ncbi:protein kinase [Streptomyces sp. NPDC051940]|uniref:protein kinase domain-containing protein n=1 Tax=Streptomyces sp. NPDC051940 TaxID=3155675 RepID=UPI003441A44A
MQAGDVLDGRYELVRRLDAGGMGEVWEGVDRRIRRPVAVKVLREEAHPDTVEELVDRLGREATAAGRLAHPHIVSVYDYNHVGRADGPLVYIVMEMVRGRSLAMEISSGLPGVEQALEWSTQIALALEAAHAPEVGVVHRDLKPGNVMITPGRLVKLLDFGIARFMEESETQNARLTGARMVGTPAYMAPEQCLGTTVDGRTDLYALGCLLFAMLTGRPPFPQDRGILQVMYKQVNDAPQRPSALRPEVPPEVDRLVLHLLEKDPADRPADAAEVVDLLRTVALGGPAAATASGAEPVDPDEVVVLEEWVDEDDVQPDWDPDPDDFFEATREELRLRRDAALAASAAWDTVLQLEALSRDAAELLGPDDPMLTDIRFELACALARDGRSQHAAAMLGEVLPGIIALHGPYDRRTLYARSLYPWYLAQSGQALEASRLFGELAPILRAVMGDTHPVTLGVRFQEATQLRAAGEHDRALRAWQHLIPLLSDETIRRELPAGMPQEARRQLAAGVLEASTRDAVSPKRIREAVPRLIGLLDNESEAGLAARSVLVRWISDAGNPQEARPAWRVLVADTTRALGDDHVLALRARFGLAENAEETGAADDALAVYRELLPDLLRVLPQHDELVLRTRYAILQLQDQLDLVTNAALTLPDWDALTMDLTRYLGPDNELTIDACFQLALQTAATARRPAEALSLLEGVLDRRIALKGHHDELNLQGRFTLARVLSALGRHAEAERLWGALLPDVSHVLGMHHALTRATMAHLDRSRVSR